MTLNPLPRYKCKAGELYLLRFSLMVIGCVIDFYGGELFADRLNRYIAKKFFLFKKQEVYFLGQDTVSNSFNIVELSKNFSADAHVKQSGKGGVEYLFGE